MTNNEIADPPKEKHPISMLTIAALGGILLAVYIGYLWLLLKATDVQTAAQIGDAYGVLSGLLNGAGLIAAVAAVILQRHALRETQKEVQITAQTLREQVLEAARSADAQEKSVAATRLLANVQGLTALLANVNSIRTVEITRIDQLRMELVGVQDATIGKDLHRKLAIERELRELAERLRDWNKSAIGYEKELTDLLSTGKPPSFE